MSANDSKGLERYQGRGQTIQANSAGISGLVEQAAATFDEGNGPRRVDLRDMDALNVAASRYLHACADNSVMPSVRGLAGHLGYSRQALYAYARRHAESDFDKWLQDFSDSCGETMMNAALHGLVAPVPAIFVAKSRYGFSEGPTRLEIAHNPLGEQQSTAELMERYSTLIELDGEDGD